ncbi:putrescine utilization regulator PtrR [Rosenbergiella australiborealis]|uniref:putrescine utilization regulator PtrR n=1 Tax=Rosenbergiella australiborealis TaxID=1544696 RepID=UPI001F4DFE6C|nr:LysR family transcriptional regulator [Rosenbergiella australiborealis]
MDLVQLKMFCVVAECGSIVKAAEQLHRVPSNLTTRLKQLEEEVASPLFIREKQRLRLSPIGHDFLTYARKILQLSEEALQLTRSAEPSGTLTLGSLESVAATRLPALLSAYHRRYPAVQLSLVTGTSGEILEGVIKGELAVALTDQPPPRPDIICGHHYQDRLVLITNPAHPAVSVANDVTGETFFAFRNSCSYRHRLEQWFAQAEVTPGPIMEIQSYHAMLACVAGGAGLAVIPYSLLSQLSDHTRVAVHQLPDSVSRLHTSLIWRREGDTPNVRALSALMAEIYPPE